jgi:hypothetical protein
MGGTLYLSMIDAHRTPRYVHLNGVAFAPADYRWSRASWFRASFCDAPENFASIPPVPLGNKVARVIPSHRESRMLPG